MLQARIWVCCIARGGYALHVVKYRLHFRSEQECLLLLFAYCNHSPSYCIPCNSARYWDSNGLFHYTVTALVGLIRLHSFWFRSFSITHRVLNLGGAANGGTIFFSLFSIHLSAPNTLVDRPRCVFLHSSIYIMWKINKGCSRDHWLDSCFRCCAWDSGHSVTSSSKHIRYLQMSEHCATLSNPSTWLLASYFLVIYSIHVSWKWWQSYQATMKMVWTKSTALCPPESL